jgi:hypothetical protein
MVDGLGVVNKITSSLQYLGWNGIRTTVTEKSDSGRSRPSEESHLGKIGTIVA